MVKPNNIGIDEGFRILFTGKLPEKVADKGGGLCHHPPNPEAMPGGSAARGFVRQ